MTKTIVAIGDVHVGDRFALAPPDFQTSLGTTYILNRGQSYLLDCFEHMQKQLPKRFDILLINGDVIQGTRRARDIWEPDDVFQARAAVALLKPLARRARKTYITRGTLWHSGEGNLAEELVGEALGAEKWESSYCHPWLHLNLDDVKLDIGHAQSVMTRYRTSSLDREIQFAPLIKEWGGGADLIVRSHSHHFLFVNIEGKLALSLPGWQLQNVFLQLSKLPSRNFPKFLGAARINIWPKRKGGGQQDAGEYIAISPMLYPHPPLVQEIPFGQ